MSEPGFHISPAHPAARPQAVSRPFLQNFISQDKKFCYPIVLEKIGVILRGFLQKERPEPPIFSAKQGKRTHITKHHFVLWLTSVVSNK
jgi:hypothetical protein